MALLSTGGGQGKKSAAEAVQAMAAENEAIKPRIAAAGAIRPLVQMVRDGVSLHVSCLHVHDCNGQGKKSAAEAVQAMAAE